MTKVIKLWKRFSFWNKIRAFLLSIGIGSETALYFADSIPFWHYIAGGATVIAMMLTYLIKDENKNNILDIFE